ncbi:MAG: AGE family epimerase/isomerase [Patescibacteria group bacterium]|nr:AGE family epimerase/isomerase [Patescibacteria group bacterium]
MSFDICKIPASRVKQLREQYRYSLFEDIVPWWMKHSPDKECGGLYSCLERDGHAYAGDKFMWMTGRQIWMLSHLYNNYEKRSEWLELAQEGERFLTKYAFADNNKMYFRLTRKGEPVARSLSLFTECFAAIALAELSKASGERQFWDRAITMYERIRPRLGKPDDTALLGYPINAQFHLHSHDMIRITVVWVFNEILSDNRWEEDITLSVKSILEKHWKPELGALLESVSPEGKTLLDLPEGRMVHPGHAIESAWMLMEIARRRKDESLMKTAIDITLTSLEFGWDQQYGGVRYLRNLDGTPTHPLEADLKLWWPHGETLYALLLAWAYTGRDDIRKWYEKVHHYTFSHFPDPEYGEWFGYLNRDGSPVFTAKANGWKGFFHVPRILFRGYQLLSKAEAL